MHIIVYTKISFVLENNKTDVFNNDAMQVHRIVGAISHCKIILLLKFTYCSISFGTIHLCTGSVVQMHPRAASVVSVGRPLASSSKKYVVKGTRASQPIWMKNDPSETKGQRLACHQNRWIQCLAMHF